MSKNLTIKDVNARVEQLATSFQQCLQDFKTEFSTMKTTPDGPREEYKSDFLKRFEKFEEHVNSSLAILKEDISRVKHDLASLEEHFKGMAMKYNNNFIIIHGIDEDKSDMLGEIINLFNSKLKLESNSLPIVIKKENIAQCYRLGKKDNKKCRPVAVQLCHRWIRDKVFYNKKQLKGTEIVITEFLTADNLKLFKYVREILKNDTWTFNGYVYVSLNKSKHLIRSKDDFLKLQESEAHTRADKSAVRK